MLPTPSTSHVSFDNIYEPAEDSYLFLDTLSSASETSFLSTHFNPNSPTPLVLEVGVGSGVVLTFIAANAPALFGRTDLALLGTDVNLLASRAASETARRARTDDDTVVSCPHGHVDIVAADLAAPMRGTQVDVLIFNPPYVPTETLPVAPTDEIKERASTQEVFERDSKLLELSYAGGLDGMETTNRLLAQTPDILSQRGVAYILLCAQNKPFDVQARVQAWPGGWSAEIVGHSGKKAGWEKLCILRIWRNMTPDVNR